MVDFKKIRTIKADERNFIVKKEDFSSPYGKGADFKAFMRSVPNILGGKDFKEVVGALAAARSKKRGIVWGIGPHTLKVGLSPLLIQLMEKGFITAIAMNGAGAIHDYEIAFFGATSEIVADGIEDGSYGMSEETGKFINGAAKEAAEKNEGFGRTVGRKILEGKPKFAELSILASAYKLGIPATLHVAIGTDTIHIHPSADGAALGKASHRDLQIFGDEISRISNGGVYLNAGSAVLLPEVFLKSLTACNNLGMKVANFTTVNLDFIKQYREMENVVRRPTLHSGKGYSIVGHHELLLPLLAANLIESA
ncbi:MAG: hypothetical protein V1835_01220 [Candidatus Micrarchaeota archaeon]